jgi:hypothetical protein
MSRAQDRFYFLLAGVNLRSALVEASAGHAWLTLGFAAVAVLLAALPLIVAARGSEGGA